MKTALVLALLMAGPAFASAADMDIPTRPAPVKKACRWVSDCQTCARGPDGKLVCSNPGIACQPRKQRCVPE